MTSSPKPALEPLPPAFSSMWRLCKLGYSHEPGLMLAAFLCFASGVVLDTVTRGRREMKLLAYLQQKALGGD